MFLRHSAFDVTKEILELLNCTLLEHGIRTAFIFTSMLNMEEPLPREAFRKLLFISIFHDIGAYKSDEITNLITFDSDITVPHSVYGYLFLRYITSVSDMAEVIFYHHMDYQDSAECHSKYKKYALMLHLADRVDVAFLNGRTNSGIMEMITSNAGTKFSPYDVRLFVEADKKLSVLDRLRNGGYAQEVKELYDHINYTEEEVIRLAKALVFAIDFRSEQTVLHTMQTADFASLIGKKLAFGEDACRRLYYAGMLHDIGKIKIPLHILENPGRLTDEEMRTMRLHVSYTREILAGKVEDELLEIAARHHEKLNGSGYPDQLTADDLTLPQRVMAVADIASALYSRRTYKEQMPKDKILGILNGMAGSGLIDAGAAAAFSANFDYIIDQGRGYSTETIRRYEALKRNYRLSSEWVDSGRNDIFQYTRFLDPDTPVS